MSTSRGGRPSRKGILIVDDEKLLRWSIREALKKDYRIWSADSAEKALKLAPRIKNLDALLVDIRLPGASGYDLIRDLRQLHPGIKVFVMTGYDPELAPRQAFSVRADGFLSKPFPMEMLRDMLTSHLLIPPPRPEKCLHPA